ncbi:MAG: hypothetical protein ACKVS9_02305 [Phycisphaerae bacterium]
MSAIPPTWLGSILQTGGAQQKSSVERAKADAAQSASGPSFGKDLINAIQTGDADNRPDADGTGNGGQGRAGDDVDTAAIVAQTPASESPTGGSLDIQA